MTEALLAVLRAGGVAILPTDTVYGLAALPDRSDGIETIFRLKGRAPDKAIPILAAEREDLSGVAVFDRRSASLADRLWPGPLTLVVPRAAGFESYLGGLEDGSVGVRVPDSELLRGLLRISGPLAVTSANLSGQPPARTVSEARRTFPDLPALDGGPAGGRPSTVVRMPDGDILREGGIDRSAIEEALRSEP